MKEEGRQMVVIAQKCKNENCNMKHETLLSVGATVPAPVVCMVCRIGA